MKKSFMDELAKLCEGRGYEITAIDIEGEVVEVKFNVKKPEDYKLQLAFPELT